MRHIHSRFGDAFRRLSALNGPTKVFLSILVVTPGAFIASGVLSGNTALRVFQAEKDKKAPINYGYGKSQGKTPPSGDAKLAQNAQTTAGLALAITPPGGGGGGGLFSPAFPWPIIPLHMGLLPDGRVLSYGTDEQGQQGAQLVYDIWDPKIGTGTNSHSIRANTTKTDIFCSAGSLIGAGLSGNTSLTGKMLILGGDVTINGERNYSDNNIDTFDPKTNKLAAAGRMKFKRWYPSITTLPNGDKLLLGGQLTPGVGAVKPEVYKPTSGWRTLSSISISDEDEWFYPRGIVGPDGAVNLLQHNGKIFRLTLSGSGTMTNTGALMAPGNTFYPSVMMPGFTPNKVLMVRANQRAQVVDLSSYPPVVSDVDNLHYDRIWGNLTLLADGGILATGGSGVYNEETNVAYQAEIMDPRTGTWTVGAAASIPRLYHSATLLLPDGSVLTAGGGAPGPVNNLNAEIYYPSYLYNYDGSGTPAPRPKIVSAPTTIRLGQSFTMTVGTNDVVDYINLVRLGYNTHAYDSEQRLVPVPFSQSGTTVTGHVDSSAQNVPPGYYMIFLFNTQGHPALAKIVSIPQAIQ